MELFDLDRLRPGSRGSFELPVMRLPDGSDLRLPVLFDAEFRGGRGRIELEFSARRRGREVTTGLESLRVVPAKR